MRFPYRSVRRQLARCLPPTCPKLASLVLGAPGGCACWAEGENNRVGTAGHNFKDLPRPS